MDNVPNEIYLQVSQETKDFNDHNEVTWSTKQINDSDIQYIESNRVIALLQIFASKIKDIQEYKGEDPVFWIEQIINFNENITDQIIERSLKFLKES